MSKIKRVSRAVQAGFPNARDNEVAIVESGEAKAPKVSKGLAVRLEALREANPQILQPYALKRGRDDLHVSPLDGRPMGLLKLVNDPRQLSFSSFCLCLLTLLASSGALAQGIPGGINWGDVTESQRQAATSPMNARSRVANVRYALSSADPSGARGFEVDADTEALRGTYRLVVPIFEARGRDNPLQIALQYQARMWLGESEANFAVLDGDPFSAPGWSLSLPKLLGGILIEGDGTRHPARRTVVTALGAEEAEVEYLTTDGSNIKYKIELNPPVNGADRSARAVVRYPDGSLTLMEGHAGTSEAGGTSAIYTSLYPTAMVDQNGNTTTIEYMEAIVGAVVTGVMPEGIYGWPKFTPYTLPMRPRRLTDPIGREINFYYNNGRQLTAITLSGNGAPEQPLVRLTYRTIDTYKLIAGFSPTKPTDNIFDIIVPVSALEAIVLPATGSGYWFGAPDSYNTYGMITNVREQTLMTHVSTSLNDAGQITNPGTTVRQRIYNYPQTAPMDADRQKFPRYTTMTEIVAGMNAPIITHYEIYDSDAVNQVTITLPDGSIRQSISDATTALPRYRERQRANGTFISSESYVWTMGADGVNRLAQLTEMMGTPQSLRARRMEYTYTQQGFLQDERIRDWVDAMQIDTAPLLRWTRYEYAAEQRFINRGIRGLVSRIEVYNGSSLLPEERTDYEYDTLPITPSPGIERNVFSTAGFRTDLSALFPNNSSNVRGLITRINRWIQPSTQGNTSTIATLMNYTAAGTLASVSVGGQLRYSVGYSATGRYGLPDQITAGAGAATVKTQLSWNTNTGKLSKLIDPWREISFGYDSALRLSKLTDSRGGTVLRQFSADEMSYQESQVNKAGQIIANSTTELNGFGLPRHVMNTTSGQPPTEAFFEYDSRGRLSRSARNQTIGANPTWTTYAHDAADRLTQTTLPDGSTSFTDYSRVGLPANAITTGIARTEMDAWGRTRFIISDALNRVVQVLESPTAGAAWVSTLYGYDARSNLLAVDSDANPAPYPQGGRRFGYDGLSRLTHRYLLERNAALDDGGNVSITGKWSDRYLYDDQSRLTGHTDPRGVFTSFDYQGDQLDRLFAIRVTAPAGIPSVPEIRFSYNTINAMLLSREEVIGLYTASYTYDKEKRLSRIETAFDNLHETIVQQVERNDAGQITKLVVGPKSKSQLQLDYGYDANGRQNSVSTTTWNVAAKYNPGGLATHFDYSSGAWRANEDFTLDPVRNAVTRQQLSINGQAKIDLQYYYTSAGAPPSPLQALGENYSTGQLREMLDALTGMVYGYEYDSLARLNLAVSNPNQQFTALRDARGFQYSYDSAGNRTAARGVRNQQQAGPIVVQPADGLAIAPQSQNSWQDLGDEAADGQRELTIDARTNHIASAGYAYDPAGNIIRLPRKDGSVLLLDYDAWGRLARIQRNGSTESESYSYNQRNQVVMIRRSNGSTRYSVWNGLFESAAFERAAKADILTHAQTTVTLAGRAVVQLDGKAMTPLFLHYAPNATFTTTPGRKTADAIDLRPYGFNPQVTPASTKGLHTYNRNSFGLDYAINRYYDPETGRFLQPDPLGESVYNLEDPQTLNLYLFTRADPINRRDLLGLDTPCGDQAELIPDEGGGYTCIPLGKTIYQTVVHDTTDAGEIVRSWIPSDTWRWAGGLNYPVKDNDGAYEEAVDTGLRKQLKKMNESKDKCAVARANYAAAANAYVTVSQNVAIYNHNIQSLQYQAAAQGFEAVETITEEGPRPQFPVKAAKAANNYLSIQEQIKSFSIQKAQLQTDQKNAIEALKSAEEARNQACQ